MLDILITYMVCGDKTSIRSHLSREQTASLLVAIATRSDTGSPHTLDLIQNRVPTHYVCNWFISSNCRCDIDMKNPS